MSYSSSQFRGSMWQQNRHPFLVDRYSQMYGSYGSNNQFTRVSAYYGYTQEGYRSSYGSGAVSSFRSMGYGSPSPSGYYPSDRMSSYQSFYGQIQQKRPSQSALGGSPRSKRQRLENDSFQISSRRRRRRRRDSRRARNSKSDDRPVRSADTNYDDYDSWKSSEDENETRDSVAQDDICQTANTVEEMDESDTSTGIKKPLACHVCKIKCSTLERFGNHMDSRTHKLKMEMLLVLQQEKKQDLEASVKASQRVGSQDRSKKGRKNRKQWCSVCDMSYSGNFLIHRKTKEHRKKRDKKFPRCRLCSITFDSAEEYKEHCGEECHKVKSGEYHYARRLAVGSDDDAAAIEPMKVQTVVVVQEGDKEQVEGENSIVASEEQLSDSKSKQSTVPKEIQPIGQLFVVPTKGYYCKICHMFFKDASIAKVKHCCSTMHNETFKKAMKEAMAEEEERQKLADEQERSDEAAEKEHVGAQVAAVDKGGEEVAKEDNGSVEKQEQEANNTGSNKSDQIGDANVEKMAVCDVANVVKHENIEITGEEIKEGIEEDKGNTSVEKVEMSSMAVVVKQEPEVIGQETKSVEEVKGGTEPLRSSALVTSAVEKTVETAQSDNQGDKVCEEMKKESPGTNGMRRGRGRGQSRGRGRRR